MAFRRGPNTWLKPEHALGRANDLLQLGQKNSALEVLSQVASRRNKVWEKSLETVVIRFLDLAVETGKGKRAKDVLHQYRNVAQQQQPQSLENVLRHFIKISEQATYVAKQKVDEQIATATDEAVKERIEREILSPWLRFLWETYRTVLEILRTNTRLEVLYKSTAEQAFEYCIKFNRTNEFKRLAELLRTHVTNTLKMTPTYYEAQENVLYQLNIRFAQLNAAVKLQLWQEAFRTVEDMKGTVLVHSKTPVPPQMMAAYYEHLATLFFISKNFFHHALALAKFSAIKKEIAQGDDQDSVLTSEVDKVMSSKVLLASLCTRVVEPVDRAHDMTLGNSYDIVRDRDLRLASLLDFDGDIRRDVLLEQAVLDDVPKQCYDEVKQLYDLLETKFRPLHFGRDFAAALKFVEGHDDLKQYLPRLQEVGFQKLLLQLVRVYRTMELAQLQRLLQPRDVPLLEVEQQLIRAFREGIVPGSIDHIKGIINFEAEQVDQEDMRFKLAELARSLRACVALIEPDRAVKALEKKRAAWKLAAAGIDDERKRVLERRALIERVKELREAKEARDAKDREEREKKEREDFEAQEEQRRKDTAAKREAKAAAAAKAENDRKKAEALAAKLTEMTSKTAPTVAAKVKKDDMVKEMGQKVEIDPEAFVKEQIKKVYEEAQKAEQAVLTANTRMDHMVRARRELEAPLVAKLSEERVAAAKKAVEQQRTDFFKQHRATFDNALALKQRLSRMNAARSAYEQKAEEDIANVRVEKEQKRAKDISEWRKLREPQLRAKLEEEAARRRKAEEDALRKAEEERAREQRYAEDMERYLEEEEEEEAQRDDWRAVPASGAAKPWRTPGGAAPAPAGGSEGGAKPWRTPGGAPAAASASREPASAGDGPKPWRTPAGGPPPSAASREPAPSSDAPKPWRRPGGEDSAPRMTPPSTPSASADGEAKPWRRPGGDDRTAAPTSSAAPSQPWRRPGGGDEGGRERDSRPPQSFQSESGAPTQPWRRPGGGAGDDGQRDSRPSQSGQAEGDSRPWRRPGGGGGDDRETSRAPSGPTSGGAPSQPWRRPGGSAGGDERPPSNATPGGERPWRGRAEGGDSASSQPPTSTGAPVKPWKKQ